MKPVTLMEVKQALRDRRFRDSLPKEFQEEVQKYLQNPGCSCNVPLYKRIMLDAKQQLQEYYPNRTISNLDEEVRKLSENHWRVISCSADKLEEELRRLPPGRKQLAIARWENQVTVVINELDLIF